MSREYPISANEGIRNVVMDVILTVVTCGIYGLYWQYKQMETLNAWRKSQEFSFIMWFLLSFLTCGIYAMFHAYKMAKVVNEIQEDNDFRVNSDLPVISLLLTVFGLGIIAMAIQQGDINKLYA